MFTDFVLIITTLVAAIVGICWNPDQRKPTPKKKNSPPDRYDKKMSPVLMRLSRLDTEYGRPILFVVRTVSRLNFGQRALLAIAVVASVASFVKAWQDDSDKNFLQLAVASTLEPGSTAYIQLYPDLYAAVKESPANLKDKNFLCYHVQGLTCFFQNDGAGAEHGTLVLDRTELGKMDANSIREASNAALSKEYATKHFARDLPDEEVFDKMGILGRNLFHHFQNDLHTSYTIDTIGGVTFLFDENVSIVITPAEIMKAAKAAATGDEKTVAGLKLFYEIEKLYRERFKTMGVTCRRPTGC